MRPTLAAVERNTASTDQTIGVEVKQVDNDISSLNGFAWSIAEILRGDFK